MMLRSWLNFRIKYLVRLANAARDARRWERAVQLYRKALDFAPQDARIWVQYGHALKEAGDLKDPVLLGKSELAYRRAITIAPTMGDTHLQLGHVLKLQGRMEVAVSAYCLAAVLDPATPYHRELAGAGWSDVQLAELARLGTHASLDGGPPATGEKWGRPTRWFFVGDTLEWIDAHDHLTGVGRVTAELLLASFQLSEHIVVPCTTGDSTSGLVSVDNYEDRKSLAQLVGWSEEFPQSGLPRGGPQSGDHVFFTGLVWTEHYQSLFRRISRLGISFSVLIHDIIPIVQPEFVGEAYEQSFTRWLQVAVLTASTLLVATQHVAEQLSRWITCEDLWPRARIQLVNFGFRPAPDGDASELAPVDRAAFVLCVGTIDTRKNQALLCRVWQKLVAELGEARTPQLVLVGRDDVGIGVDAEFSYLRKAGKLVVLTGLSDAEVAVLYRSCLFTVFASKSEGYGLPVAESLSYGKLCISADLAVVREHAGDFAWYFDPASPESALAALKRALLDRTELAAAEEAIRRGYRIRSWSETFGTMLEAMAQPTETPALVPGRQSSTSDRTLSHQHSSSILAKAGRWCGDDMPEVSILIINRDHAALTLNCIRHVWAHTEEIRYEIIVADNGSTPGDVRLLGYLGAGVRLIKIGVNRFFGEANNIAAEAARGRYLCLLNHNSLVCGGWLGALTRPLRLDETLGATGPLFIFPDGRVQEAGAMFDDSGYPNRMGRGQTTLSSELYRSRIVDYVSAAAIVVHRDLFMRVGGFDLAYEPAHYEDADLCFKLRAFGRPVLFCPDAKVVHLKEEAANSDITAGAHRQELGEINRRKFVARWGSYLRDREVTALDRIRRHLPLPSTVSHAEGVASPASSVATSRPRAVVFTPYPLTAGGGERYFLSMAALLKETHSVMLVTPYRYSALRVEGVGAELSLDLAGVVPTTKADLLQMPAPDAMVAVNNHAVPPIAPAGGINILYCQFPFPMNSPPTAEERNWLSKYNKVVANSAYAAQHIKMEFRNLQLPEIDTVVLYPPVRHFSAGPRKLNRIVSVGRFFHDGHSKRHDRLIQAFKRVVQSAREPIEFHIVGSSVPDPAHMAYLASLIASAEGFPINFHVNASTETLASLYGSARLYWHGTGLDVDLRRSPWAAEHFGMTIVEAMSAGAVPFAFRSGGPLEIIEHGKSGFLYDSIDDLIDQTLNFLAMSAHRKESIAEAAAYRARDFNTDVFTRKWAELIGSIDDRNTT